jgi:hypothetical protein
MVGALSQRARSRATTTAGPASRASVAAERRWRQWPPSANGVVFASWSPTLNGARLRALPVIWTLAGKCGVSWTLAGKVGGGCRRKVGKTPAQGAISPAGRRCAILNRASYAAAPKAMVEKLVKAGSPRSGGHSPLRPHACCVGKNRTVRHPNRCNGQSTVQSQPRHSANDAARSLEDRTNSGRRSH